MSKQYEEAIDEVKKALKLLDYAHKCMGYATDQLYGIDEETRTVICYLIRMITAAGECLKDTLYEMEASEDE